MMLGHQQINVIINHPEKKTKTHIHSQKILTQLGGKHSEDATGRADARSACMDAGSSDTGESCGESLGSTVGPRLPAGYS